MGLRFNFCVSHLLQETILYDIPINVWDEVISIQSFFQPLLMSTLQKNEKSPVNIYYNSF